MATHKVLYEVRDLKALEPDDYEYPAFDVLATVPNGDTYHSEEMFDTKDAAEIFIAGCELKGFTKASEIVNQLGFHPHGVSDPNNIRIP